MYVQRWVLCCIVNQQSDFQWWVGGCGDGEGKQLRGILNGLSAVLNMRSTPHLPPRYTLSIAHGFKCIHSCTHWCTFWIAAPYLYFPLVFFKILNHLWHVRLVTTRVLSGAVWLVLPGVFLHAQYKLPAYVCVCIIVLYRTWNIPKSCLSNSSSYQMDLEIAPPPTAWS